MYPALLILMFPLSIFAADAGAGTAVDREDNRTLTARELFDKGQFPEAAELFLKEDGESALYNSARCWHENYIKNSDFSSLQKAADGYYRVLDRYPDMTEARKNLELIRKEQEKNQSSEQQQGEGQKGAQSQDSSNSSDQLNQMADRQQDLAEKSGNSAGKEQNKQDQESLHNETQKAADQAQSEEQKNALQNAAEEQEKAMAQMEQGQDASDAQNNAAEALRKAARTAEKAGPNRIRRFRRAGRPTAPLKRVRKEQDGLPEDLQAMLNGEQDREKETVRTAMTE